MIAVLIASAIYLWALGGLMLGMLYRRDMEDWGGAIMIGLFWPIIAPLAVLGSALIEWRDKR